jgi:hypothetical protein
MEKQIAVRNLPAGTIEGDVLTEQKPKSAFVPDLISIKPYPPNGQNIGKTNNTTTSTTSVSGIPTLI